MKALIDFVKSVRIAGITQHPQFFVYRLQPMSLRRQHALGGETGASAGWWRLMVAGAGIAAIAVGIPLIIYGAKKVPVGAAPIAGALPGMPAWAGAPGGTGWRWRF